MMYPQLPVRSHLVSHKDRHLSLLYFIIINDLVSDIQSTVRLFADDCFIYYTICSPTDHNILQGLDTLSK